MYRQLGPAFEHLAGRRIRPFSMLTACVPCQTKPSRPTPCRSGWRCRCRRPDGVVGLMTMVRTSGARHSRRPGGGSAISCPAARCRPGPAIRIAPARLHGRIGSEPSAQPPGLGEAGGAEAADGDCWRQRRGGSAQSGSADEATAVVTFAAGWRTVGACPLARRGAAYGSLRIVVGDLRWPRNGRRKPTPPASSITGISTIGFIGRPTPARLRRRLARAASGRSSHAARHESLCNGERILAFLIKIIKPSEIRKYGYTDLAADCG
jgi:hypothetical protein